jgi:hypothetical protein
MVQATVVNKYTTWFRNPKLEPQQQITALFGTALAVASWFKVSPAAFEVQCL